MPRDILIDPQRTGSGNPNIQFSGSAGNTILLEVLSEGSVQFTGVSGSLLRISDFPAAGGSLNSLFLSGTVAITGSFIPGESNGFDLGSSTKKWANIYSTNIIGSLTGSNLTAGQVVVAGTGGVLSGSNNLFWNDTSGYLGVGTSSPIGRFSVGNGNQSVVVDSTGTGGVGSIQSYNGALRINNGGNNTILNTDGGVVGIGTTSPPASKFFVSGSVTLSDPVVIIKAGVSSPTGGASVLDVQNSAGTSLLFVSGSGAVGIGTTVSQLPSHKLHVSGKIGGGLYVDSSLEFLATGNTELKANSDLKLGYALSTVIRSTGNVGIGTATPSSRLHVYGSSTSTTSTAIIQEGTTPTGGAAALNVQNVAGATLFFVSGSGRVGIASSSPSARLEINLGGSNAEILALKTTYAADNSYHSMTWRDGSNITGQIDTRYDGTNVDMVFGSLYSGGYNSTERMRIKGNGNVGIGTGVQVTARLLVTGSGATSSTTTAHFVNSSGASLFYLNDAGNIGIGTASPDTSAPLTIDTTLNTHISLRGSGNTQRQAIIASNSGVSSNYNGLALYSNTNASFSQANTSLSSWRAILGNFDITADRFAVSRMAAGGASFSEFLTIVSSGNVGVGTTNPAGLLTVSGTIVTKYNTGLESYIAAGTYSAGTTGFYPVYAAGGSFGSNDTVIKYGAGGNNLVLLHGSTVVLSANSSENVSIGTNSYTGRLFVSGSSVAATPTMVVREGVSNPTGGALAFDVENSAGSSILAVTGSGLVGINTASPNAQLAVYNASLPTFTLQNSSNYTRLATLINDFYIDVGLGGTVGATIFRRGSGTAESARIDASGNVGIGTTLMDVKFVVNGNSVFSGSVNPDTDATRDLGTSSKRWRTLYASNISGSITGSNLTAGQIVVTGVGGILSGTNDLFWNNSNRRVGIGTSSPSYDFQVGSSATVGTRTLALIDSGYGIVIKGGNGNGIVQSLGTTVPLELQAGNGNNGNYYFTSTGNVGIGTATVASKIFVYTTQNDAATTPSFDFHGAFMRIGDPTTSLAFNNGVGIKFHDAGTVHYSIGQLSGNFYMSQTSDDGNKLFTPGRTDVIVFNSSGNVGIGSTSPGYKLDVNGDLNIASTRIFRVNGTAVMNTQASNGSDIYMNARVVRNESSVNTDGLYLGYGNSGTTTGHIRFFANGTTERMKIAADTGSVIISDLAGSVSTSAARLLISGSSTASTPTMIVREGVVSPTGGAGTFDVQNSAGTSLLFVSGSGTVGIGTINQGARFYVSSSLTGNAASALIIGGQVFGVSLNTFKGHTQLFQLGNGTETMRIDASGNVGIGTGALDSRLVVNGNSVFSGSANPDSDNTRSLGSSTKRWQAIYAATGSISNVVFSPVSTGNTYTTTFATGEAGRLTATKTINLSTATTFFTVSSNNGASMFDVSFVVSESGFSVARKYSVAAQFGSSASNVVTFKTVDTGPYSGSDLTVSFSKTSNTVTTCTVSHNYSPSANIAMTIDISAISSGGSPTTVTIF